MGCHPESSYICKNSSRRTPRPQKSKNLKKASFFGEKRTFFNFVLTFCPQKTRKIKFLGRGVLRDEFLIMWELSGWQSEHFLISSYGLKTTSRRPKLLFGTSYPFLRKGGKSRKSIFGTRSSSGWVLTHVRTFNFPCSTTFNLIIHA